jgi:hypothetical protein
LPRPWLFCSVTRADLYGHWRCAMWRMSNAQAPIFIAAVVVAVALLALA